MTRTKYLVCRLPGPTILLAALLGLAACDPQFSLPGSGDDSPPSQRERGEGDSSGGGMGY